MLDICTNLLNIYAIICNIILLKSYCLLKHYIERMNHMYSEKHTHRHIEELTLNHWRPLSTSFYDGWVSWFAKGYSKRANSVQAIYSSSLDVHEKIRVCEEMYTSSQLNTVFKITPFVQPGELDQLLQDKGYVVVDRTLVQLRNLEDLNIPKPVDIHIDEQIDWWMVASFLPFEFCQWTVPRNDDTDALEYSGTYRIHSPLGWWPRSGLWTWCCGAADHRTAWYHYRPGIPRLRPGRTDDSASVALGKKPRCSFKLSASGGRKRSRTALIRKAGIYRCIFLLVSR